LAPLTLLLPASPLAIYSLCPLHNRIRTGFATAFRHAATASVGAASICALCSFLWYWFGDLAFGPPAIDCEPCHEVWPSGLSCSGSCHQLVDLNCPSVRRGCPCGFRVSLSAMLSGILCPLHTGIRTGAGVIYIFFLALATAFRHAATASVGVASTYRLCPFLWYWFGDTAFGPPAIDCGPFSHRALLVPAPAVNLWILIALARRGCPCRFRVATGRYAWLRRAALLPRLCRGCGLVCMEVCYTYLCSLFWQIFCLSTDWKALNWRDDG